MVIKEISEQLAIDYLVSQRQSAGLFLQHPWWLQVEKMNGQATVQLGFFEQTKLVGLALGSYRSLFGSYKYLWLPRGPLLAPKLLPTGLALLAEYFKKEVLFIRFEPLGDRLQDFKPAVKVSALNPAVSWLTDLTNSEAVILAKMHSKTRYNIRLAEKNNLIFSQVGLAGLEDFWQLLKLTSQRDKFGLHEFKHYANLLVVQSNQILSVDQPEVKIFEVRQNNKLLAASLILFYKRTATYLHGASDYSYRKLMAPYLLHWRTLQEARQQGCLFYDWWGIALSGPKQSTWQGITRFKTGWDGQTIEYPGTFDYPLSNFGYWFYDVLRKINRLIRKLRFLFFIKGGLIFGKKNRI